MVENGANEPSDIVYYGHPSLRAKCRPVESFDGSLEALAERMAVEMYRERGVGLSAPQVGVELALLLVDIGDMLHVLANPVILKTEGSQCGPEGCLSFPGLVAEIERPQFVIVEARNLQGEVIRVEGEGFLARALCHEKDHLDGVLFIDFLNQAKRLLYERELRKFQQNTQARFGLKPHQILR